MKSMQWVIPAEWRDHVMTDLTDEQARLGRGRAWLAWHMLVVGLRLRWTFSLDAVRVEGAGALRRLRRAPKYTLAAVLMFALGSALSVTAYALAHRVLFVSLPYSQPERLVSVFSWDAESGQRYTMISKPVALRLTGDRSLVESFTSISVNDSYRIPGVPTPVVRLSLASPAVLDVLGIQPVVGRGFRSSDVAEGRSVAVITHAMWISAFGADPLVVGRTLTAPGRTQAPVEIVGVLPPAFVLPSVNWSAGTDGLHLDLEPADRLTGNPRADVMAGLVVRLAAGRTAGDVQRRVDDLLREDAERSGRTSSYLVQPLQEGLFWRYRPTLQLLAVAAMLIWALGCANLSLMVAARAAQTQFDRAVSAALGASTTRLAVGSFVETLVICGAGAGLGVLAVLWSGPALAAVVPPALGELVETDVSLRVLLTGLGLMTLGAALVGLWPAFRVRRVDVLTVLRDGATHGPRGRQGRTVLLVHACLGLILMVGALHALGVLWRLSTMDLGFEPRGLYGVYVQLQRPAVPPMMPTERWANLRATIERLRAEPWVAAASAEHAPLFMGQGVERGTRVGGQTAAVRPVLDGFVAATGASLLAGRDVDRTDLGGGPVVWLSESVARAAWPDADPSAVVGRVLSMDGHPDRRVAGVFRDRRRTPLSPVEREVVIPASPEDGQIMVLARVRPESVSSITPAERFAPVFGVAPNDGTRVQVIDANAPSETALKTPRLSALAFGVLGVLAATLGAFGLIAVSSRTAADRHRELALRAALGASPWSLARVLLAAVVTPTALGLAAGAITLVLGQRVMGSVLPTGTAFAVDGGALWWVGAGALGYLALACISTLATWRRIARENPMDVLKGV
jgi:putative ABC transport system permease protein